MLRKLQIQLTLFYFFASMILVILVGAGLYYRLSNYFQSSTDLLLKYRLAQELRALTEPVSPELEAAEQQFLTTVMPKTATPSTLPLTEDGEESETSISPTLVPLFKPTGQKPKPSDNGGKPESEPEEETESSDDSSFIVPSQEPVGDQVNVIKSNLSLLSAQSTPQPVEETTDAVFSGEVASIFVITVDRNGTVASIANSPRSTIAGQIEALQAARQNQTDIRTVHLQNGIPVRLLSYHLPDNQKLAFIQVGRPVDDQLRLLDQFLVTWIGISLICLLFTGAGSWWLAGKTLMPAQQSMLKQQEFVANASHELRTPLTLIRASTEMALRTDSSHESRKLLNDVLSDVDDMSKLFDDLLLLSRLDEQKLSVKIETVRLADVFAEIADRSRRLGYAQTFQILLDSPELKLDTDPDRLKQVLWIITDNALKHSTAESTITLNASISPASIVIKVIDQGCGIAKEHLPYIFERFYRGSADRSKQRRGAGLGLPIAKGLIHALHGTIHVESIQNKGTTVTFSLPRA